MFLKSVDIFALLYVKRNIETWGQLRACNVNSKSSGFSRGGEEKSIVCVFPSFLNFFF